MVGIGGADEVQLTKVHRAAAACTWMEVELQVISEAAFAGVRQRAARGHVGLLEELEVPTCRMALSATVAEFVQHTKLLGGADFAQAVSCGALGLPETKQALLHLVDRLPLCYQAGPFARFCS